ncbi:ornithine carbamoyltransferase [candidate division KSB1 bacterium]|nr:ornithine carbamoyltransferase [candidate division KSB1 bacterium]
MTKDFLSIAELTRDEIDDIFALSQEIKSKLKQGETYHPLKGKTLAMIFQKPSARTRISFETGMFQLGGHALYLAPSDIGVGTRESYADVARVVSRYNDIIMARLFGHEGMIELARHSDVPVINGLTDLLHPCQVMADTLTILEHLGRVEGVHITFVGDGNNLANSWLNFASKYPVKLNLAIPEGFDPDSAILKNARANHASEINILRDPAEAVKNADVIYTDVWASMGQEAEAEKRNKVFQSYQINSALIRHAKPNVLVMHCLPAHRGYEITDEVIDGPHSIVFDEAENRLHVQKAIMVKLLS